ncbi:hypothetical protein [Agrococcus sp. ProA11]|uniref:DUF6153 family protein n=1 Tax=Agrococcus chionoecetis TaxID=3153752 RepID=UPI0032614749
MGTWQPERARVVSRGLPLRALLLMGTTVVLLIVGLLGMHALAGSTGGHTGAGAVQSGAAHADTSVAATGAHHVEAGSPPAVALQHAHTSAHADAAVGAASHKDLQCAETCAGTPLGHEHIAVACVLALLAGLLLLTPPRVLARGWMPAMPALGALSVGSTQIGPPPPSLIQLSISRT